MAFLLWLAGECQKCRISLLASRQFLTKWLQLRSVGFNDVLVLPGRILDDPFSRGEIHIHKPEPGIVALRPLKVIHHGPVLIAQQGNSLIGRPLELA